MGTLYAISSIGFTDQDIGALRRLLLLSTVRDRVYAYIDDPDIGADIVLINVDDAAAVHAARARWGDSQSAAEGATRPVLAYAAANPVGTPFDEPILFRLPIRGSQVIHLLDRIAAAGVDRAGARRVVFNRGQFDRKRERAQEERRARTRPVDYEVLLLVDDAGERERMEILLRARGMTPVVAADDEEAMDIIDRRAIRLAYVVHAAPGVDSARIRHHVAQAHPARDLPIVLLLHPGEGAPAADDPDGGPVHQLTRPVSRIAFNRSLLAMTGGGDLSAQTPA